MRYWWVNQKQTYRHEVPGRYMWSPKLNKAGRNIRAYDLMTVVAPGDIVFSYANAMLKAVGIVVSNCYEFPRPIEFGKAGRQWSEIGWRVDVDFREMANPVRPKEHISALRSVLPEKYSPLQSATGYGNQHSYLYLISSDLAYALAHLMDRLVLDLVVGNFTLETIPDQSLENQSEWEDRIEEDIQSSTELRETEKDALIQSRRGQGQFRRELAKIESACRVTGVRRIQHLVASHTKPWRDCSNEERLDPENGFMLTPTVDHLFDRGFISFEDTGNLIVSSVAHQESLVKMGIQVGSKFNVGSFSQGQKTYLEWHRNELLLRGVNQ